jgi:hypothetical protein
MSDHDELDAPPIETKKYVLFREDVNPCRWYLAVDGGEPQLISSAELNTQNKFRNWHSDHGLKPPNSMQRHDFEKMVGDWYDTALPYTKTLPFLQTDAGIVENLVFFFDIHIIPHYHTHGVEFMEGKVGECVRIQEGEGRVYFKWQSMKRFWVRVLNAQNAEVNLLKMFITEKGGYQPEAGARDWFRWAYWVPLSLFDGETAARWFEGDKNVRSSNVVRFDAPRA